MENNDFNREPESSRYRQPSAIFDKFLRDKVSPSRLELEENFTKGIEYKRKFEEKIINSIDIKIKEDYNEIILFDNLENNQINRRVDSFIDETIREWNQEGERLVPFPELVERTSKNRFSSPSGLKASVSHGGLSGYFGRMTIKGEECEPEDGRYTILDFVPQGRMGFNPAKMTDSLAKGIQGVMELLEAVDQGRFEAAPILIGTTNINMALIAQRLGFAIVDQCRTAEG